MGAEFTWAGAVRRAWQLDGGRRARHKDQKAQRGRCAAHRLLAAVATTIVSGMLSMPVTATTDIVAVIGTSRMVTALGTRFAGQGQAVIFGSRMPRSERVRPAG